MGVASVDLLRPMEAVRELRRQERELDKAARTAPNHNPTLHRLAGVYRKLGRVAEARALYERELANNAYEVGAVLALAELDLADGATEAEVQDMCEKLLANTVIESYRVEMA